MSPVLSRDLLRISKILAFVAMGIAVVAIVGWIFNSTTLISLRPNLASFKITTAFGVLLLGLDIFFSSRDAALNSPQPKLWAPGLALLLGLLSLAERLWITISGDHVHFASIAHEHHMPFVTALVIVCLSCASLARHLKPRTTWLWQSGVMAALLLLMIALLGHAYDVSTLARIYPYSMMSVHSCLALLFVTLAAWLLSPAGGALDTITSRHAGGKMARHLLPASIFTLFSWGLLVHLANRANIFDADFDIILIVTLGSATLGWLIWRAARELNNIDAGLKVSQHFLRESQSEVRDLIQSLQSLNEELEQRVLDRTQELELQSIIVSNMAEGVCLIRDSDGQIVYANPKFCSMFGYECDELEGQPVRTLNHSLPGFSGQDSAELILNQIRHKGVHTYEVQNVKKDGSLFWCRGTGSIFNHAQHGTVIVAVQADVTAQKHQQNALRESEQLYRNTVELAADGILEADLDGRYVHANRAACQMLGYTEQEIIGKQMADLIDPAELPSIQHAMQVHLAGDDILHWEWNLVRKDGSLIATDITAKTFPGNRLIAFVRDVSKRRASDAALAASERRYRTLVESAYDPIVVTNAAGDIVLTNERFCEVFGYSDTEIIGESVEKLIPINLRQHHQTLRSGYSSRQKARPMGAGLGLYGLKKDGTEFPVDISLSPSHTPEGTFVTAIIRDITDRKKHEDQQSFLAETAKLLGSTLDYDTRVQNVADAMVPKIADSCLIRIYEKDKLRCKTGASHMRIDPIALARFLEKSSTINNQYTAEHVLKTGKPVLVKDVASEIFENPEIADDFRELLLIGQVKSYIVVPLQAQQSCIGTLSVAMTTSSRQFGDADLDFVATVASRCAIAIENARLYQEAQQAVTAREGVLGVVSHDLKTPLSAIMLAAQLLQQDNLPLATTQEVGRRLGKSAIEMQRLIADLLDFGKIEAEAFSVEKDLLSVQGVVDAALESLTPRLRDKELRLEVSIASGLPPIFGDQLRLIQVLWNLIGNAIKFGPPNSRIQLKATSEGDFVKFCVADQGDGIPEEHLPRVFDRFWQAQKTATQGTGLGLAIAKGIIDAHGGQIWVENLPDAGCAFSFTVPVTLAPFRNSPSHQPRNVN